MPVSVFVLSACSGDKAVKPVIDCGDIDKSSRDSLLSRYPDATLPAESLYTGDEHKYVREAVEAFEEIADVEWRIVSAGFGLVHPETKLPSYECTFRDNESVRSRVARQGYDPSTKTQAEQIQTVAHELGIPADIKQSLAERFDVALIVLGEDYLLATGDALSSIPRDTTALAFAAKGTKDLIGDCQWVRSTAKEREALSTVWTELKGQQLRNVANNVKTAEELQALTSDRVRELSILSQSSG